MTTHLTENIQEVHLDTSPRIVEPEAAIHELADRENLDTQPIDVIRINKSTELIGCLVVQNVESLDSLDEIVPEDTDAPKPVAPGDVLETFYGSVAWTSEYKQFGRTTHLLTQVSGDHVVMLNVETIPTSNPAKTIGRILTLAAVRGSYKYVVLPVIKQAVPKDSHAA